MSAVRADPTIEIQRTIQRHIDDVTRYVTKLSRSGRQEEALRLVEERERFADELSTVRVMQPPNMPERFEVIAAGLEALLPKVIPTPSPLAFEPRKGGRPRGSKTTKTQEPNAAPSADLPVTLPTEWHGPTPETPVEEPASTSLEPPAPSPVITKPSTRKPRARRQTAPQHAPSMPAYSRVFPLGDGVVTLTLAGNPLLMSQQIWAGIWRLVDILESKAQEVSA